jgi:hypothetical protein
MNLDNLPLFSTLHNLAAVGTVFFESQDALSPRDTNGRIQDIYEWAPAGVGGCGKVSGCLSLISSGHSSADSYFVDATSSASDALFLTRDQLSLQDKDDLLDLYDARAGGGFADVSEAAPCGGETCKGPIAPVPAQQSADSSQFRGPSNPKPKRPKHSKHKKSKKKNKHKKSVQKKHKAKHNPGGSK